MPRTKAISNPNGANQWVADPRQQVFLAYYLDPKSATFSNALQSALKAGFTRNYAENILDKMPEWLREKVGNSALLLKAERNINEFLELPSKTQVIGAFGPVYEKGKKKGERGAPVIGYNKGLLEIKSKVSMFVAERNGRSKWGPKEPEGGNIFNIIVFPNEQLRRVAARVIGGGDNGSDSSKEPSN